VFGLAREALPVLTNSLQWIEQNAGGIFDAILRTTREVGPLLAQLGGAFFDIAPTINDVGTSILNVLIPAFDDALGALDKLLQGDIEGGLIEPIGDIIDSTVAYLESGQGQELLDRVSSKLFNSLAAALNGTSEGDLSGLATAVGGALRDAIVILTSNFEESGLGPALSRLAVDSLQVFSSELANYSTSEQFKEDIQVVGDNIADALFDSIKSAITETITGFNLTAFAAAKILKTGDEADDAIQSQAAENRQNVNTNTGLDLSGAGNTTATNVDGGSTNTGGSDGGFVKDLQDALNNMNLALRGELDVSDNVASMEDVDARLEQQVRSSRESGTGGTQ